MHELLRKVYLFSAADDINIDSAGDVVEFVPIMPFVATRVGIVVTTAVNPDNSVALTATMSRRPTIGSTSNAVTLGVFTIMAANATNLAVGDIVYKDLHIDDADGEQPEDYSATQARARRFEAPNSNLTAPVSGQSGFLIPAGQSFALTLDTNAEADSGAVYTFLEGYYLPVTSGVVISTATVLKDTSDSVSG